MAWKKYDGHRFLVRKSLAMPDFLAELYEDRAAETGKSFNETVNYALMSADWELAKELMQKQEQLMQALQEAKKQNRDLKQTLEKIEKISKKQLKVEIFADVEIPEEIRQVVEENKEKIEKIREKRGWAFTEAVDTWTQVILGQLEERMIKQGRVIKRRSLAKLMIKKAITDTIKTLQQQQQHKNSITSR